MDKVHNPKAKLKTLYVMRILQDETDAEHGLSLREIIERLDDYGIKAERKGLYSDIQALKDFGVNIQTFQRKPVQYAIVRRDFELSELMLLVDAVESCKFLTKRQSKALTTNLKLLATIGFEPEPPKYCYKCGDPFPWTRASLEALKELAELDDSLDEGDVEDLAVSAEEILSETPKTKVAAIRFKKILSRAGSETATAARELFVDIVAETAKRTIWPN